MIKEVIGKENWKKLVLKKSEVLSVIAPVYNTKRLYKIVFGSKLNLKCPQKFSEKLQWLKLYAYNNNELVTTCCDKYKIRCYLNDNGFGYLLPKLYGVYRKPEEIEWNILPNKFVIKCNHGSGFNILCNDKNLLDIEKTVKRLNEMLKDDYWKHYSEVQYKNIDKRIIIEEYLGDNIEAYKFYCFNGDVKFMYVSRALNGEQDVLLDYYDKDFNHLPIVLKGHINNPEGNIKPSNYGQLVNIATDLSKPFPFVRVDLYNIDNKPYISEMTFVPTGGFVKVGEDKYDKLWGEWLDINCVN